MPGCDGHGHEQELVLGRLDAHQDVVPAAPLRLADGVVDVGRRADRVPPDIEDDTGGREPFSAVRPLGSTSVTTTPLLPAPSTLAAARRSGCGLEGSYRKLSERDRHRAVAAVAMRPDLDHRAGCGGADRADEVVGIVLTIGRRLGHSNLTVTSNVRGHTARERGRPPADLVGYARAEGAWNRNPPRRTNGDDS